MFNVIIATHGNLATEFERVLKSFFGKIDHLKVINLSDQGINAFSQKIDQVIAPCLNEPTIIFCDIAGGTPFNELAKRSINWHKQVALFGGVNLPVLVETLNMRMQGKSINEVIGKITAMSALIRFNMKNAKKAEDE